MQYTSESISRLPLGQLGQPFGLLMPVEQKSDKYIANPVRQIRTEDYEDMITLPKTCAYISTWIIRLFKILYRSIVHIEQRINRVPRNDRENIHNF